MVFHPLLRNGSWHKILPAVLAAGDPLPVLLKVERQLRQTEFVQITQSIFPDCAHGSTSLFRQKADGKRSVNEARPGVLQRTEAVPLSSALEVRKADLKNVFHPILQKTWVAQCIQNSKGLSRGKNRLPIIQQLCSRSQVIQDIPIRCGHNFRELPRQGDCLLREVLIVLVGHLAALLKHIVLLPQAFYRGPIRGKIKVHKGDQLLGGRLPVQMHLLAVQPNQDQLNRLPGICQKIDTGFSFSVHSLPPFRRIDFCRKQGSSFPM